MDKYVGKRLDGRYELQELIGVGGMATVYKAYDTIDDKIVAVKILKEEFLGNDDFIRRFKNESKAIAVLSHPNIVKVFDVSFGDRIQYIVMEYIDGITLKEYIEHQKVINWKEAVHFTVQILEALEHAHEKGVVHRDIKPQNIILLQDGTIKVTDFGIARLTTSETRTMTNTAIGSVHYIAPEQARGDLTDGKADIYSVGVMLYEMLTGKLPFEAESAVSVAIMQLQTEPSPLRDINEEIPEGLEEITLKAMRKNPAQRYDTAAKMLEAIETFRRNPSVAFNYKYYDDTVSGDTKFVDTSVTSRVPAVPDQLYNDNYDYDEEDAVDTRSRKAVKWVTIGIASVVVIAIAVLIFMFTSKSCQGGSTKDVEIPDFIGEMLDDVQSNSSYKFNFKIEVKYDPSKPLMMILDQDPKAGTKTVKENSEIILTVNSSESKVNVPTVKGLSQKDAEEKVQNANLYTEIKKVYSSTVDKGYVIDCSPGEGSEQQIGTKITLFISDGPEGETVQIPTKLIGKTKAEVEAELTKLGLKTEIIEQASTEKEGIVFNIEPYEGNTVQKGSLVTIYASNGKLPTGSEREIELEVGWPNEEATVSVEVFINGSKDDNLSNDSAYLPDFGKLKISGRDKDVKVKININDSEYKIFTIDFTKDPPVATLTKENPYTSTSFKVPSVAGYSEEDARKALISAGFDAANISVENETSDTVESGKVTRTDPSEGAVVSAHSSITIFISTGNGELSEDPSSDEPSEDSSSNEPSEESSQPNDLIGMTIEEAINKYGNDYWFSYDESASLDSKIISFNIQDDTIILFVDSSTTE